MNVDKKQNDAIIILIQREAGEHKEKRHSASAAGKEEEADDFYNFMPGENHHLKKLNFNLVETAGAVCEEVGGS